MANKGFKKLEEAMQDFNNPQGVVVTPLPAAPANDNTPAGSLAFLRKAIDAPTIGEVIELVKETVQDYHVNKHITLKVGDKPEFKLGEEPRHYLFEDVLTSLFEGIPSALIGPAGSGKSTMCKQLADALTLKYYLQNSVTGTHELAGYMDAHGKYNTTSFRECFEKGGLILVDEVDTSDPSALKWINTALANGHAMFPDKADPIDRHKDFRIIIAANTFGTGADRIYVGANQLDASTLDRFVFFDFRYDEKMETILSGNTQWCRRVQSVRRAAQEEKARVVISPRATIYGAKLLRAGWDQKKVEERVLWKGMDSELRNRIEKKAK